MTDLLVRGGTVVTAGGSRFADVAVDGGRIAAVEPDLAGLAAAAGEVVDASGLLVLPGVVDVHVHVLPPSVQRKVWAYFERAEEHYGLRWPIEYAWPLERLTEELSRLGVRAYPGLVYPHKPEMAAWLAPVPPVS